MSGGEMTKLEERTPQRCTRSEPFQKVKPLTSVESGQRFLVCAHELRPEGDAQF